jgi:Gpi18-like mannosyltransferase
MKIKRENIAPAIFITDIILVILMCRTLSYLDIQTYDYTWAMRIMREGLPTIYTRMREYFEAASRMRVDYPPIYPSFLGLIAPLLKERYALINCAVMGIFPFMVTVILQCFAYCKISPECALDITTNIALIINSFIWRQRDVGIVLLTLLLFYAFKKGMCLAPSLIFAVMMLFKTQAIYYGVILILYYITDNKHDIKQKIASLGAGVITGIAGFAPFMKSAADPLLFINFYRNATDGHTLYNVNSPNIWMFLSYPDRKTGFMVYSNAEVKHPIYISLFTVIVLLALVYLTTKDFITSCVSYVFSVNFISAGMSERMWFLTLSVLLGAIYLYKRTEYLALYRVLTAILIPLEAAALNMHNLSIIREICDIYGTPIPKIYRLQEPLTDMTLYVLWITMITGTVLLGILWIKHVLIRGIFIPKK